jgi:hypothetical protein
MDLNKPAHAPGHQQRGRFSVRPSTHPTRRSIGLLALVAWLVLSALPHAAAAQSSGAAPTLDLAALVLMPADLDAEGMPGYGTEFSRTFATLDEIIVDELQLESRMWMELAKIPEAAAILTQAGWVRHHELLLATPVDPDDPNWFHSGAMSGIEEYASPEGASTAFATFSSEPALRSGHLGMVEFLPVATPIGDERTLARHTFIDEGDTIHGLTLMVRIDSLIVSVTLADYDNGIEPDPAAIERLTARMVNRVQAAQDAGAGVGPCLPDGLTTLGAAMTPSTPVANVPRMPGFDRCVQRLVGNEADPERARYTVLDGVAIPFFGETETDIAEAQADVTSRGIQDAYRTMYWVEGVNGWRSVWVGIVTYTSEAAAVADFAGAEQRWRDNPRFSELAFTPNPVAFGDESYSFTMRGTDSGDAATATYTRIGHISIEVSVYDANEPVPDIVNALLTSQVACMQANDCTAPIPVPPGLIQGA